MNRADRRERNTRGVAASGGATVPTDRVPTGKAILFSSNHPDSETGYGQQTAQVTRRLRDSGHAVAIHNNYGTEGHLSQWEGLPVFPRGFQAWSNDVVPADLHYWAAQNPNLDPLLMTLIDVWVLGTTKAWDEIPRIASWVPVDHFPAPPAVVRWCSRSNVTPIAMSKFGKTMLENAGIDRVLYVPHAIDTSVFRPTPTFLTEDGQAMTGREFMNIPADADHVTLMMSANKGGNGNPSRKSFPEAFLAWSQFAKDKPGAFLYVHTEAFGAMGGVDLPKLAKACDIDPKRIIFPDQFVWQFGIPARVMAAVYSACDVLLQPSRGEGFGIPLVEAQACGVPGIVNNATAQPELLGDGWIVDGQPEWEAAQAAWLMAPNVESIRTALQQSYDRTRGVSQTAVDFAQQYDADFVFEKFWVPALAQL